MEWRFITDSDLCFFRMGHGEGERHIKGRRIRTLGLRLEGYT